VIDSTLPLFRYAESRPVPAPTASEQNQNLARVETGIALEVLAFCRLHRTFHADALRAWVQIRGGRAPGSADRILRQLRARGAVQYRVVDRAASLYEIEAVNG
jgi:hypothetical protein